MDIFKQITNMIKGMPNKTNGLEDMLNNITTYFGHFDHAIKQGHLQPHQKNAVDLARQLQNFLRLCMTARRNQDKTCDYLLTYRNLRLPCVIPRGDLDQTIELVGKKTTELEQKLTSFVHMHDYISTKIQLDVLPNQFFNNEKVYLPQGTLIVEGRVYHAFSIRTNDRVEFAQQTDEGLPSLEMAMRHHTSPKMHGTVAIAKATGKFALNQTMLPVLAEKYETAMRSKENQIKLYENM